MERTRLIPGRVVMIAAVLVGAAIVVLTSFSGKPVAGETLDRLESRNAEVSKIMAMMD